MSGHDAGSKKSMPCVDARRRQQVIEARKRAEHFRRQQTPPSDCCDSRAILRTTAYTPRSACTGANEPEFGVPSSTTRSTCSSPGMRQRRAAHEPAHAVRDDHQSLRWIAAQALRELAARAHRRRAASRSRENRREPGDAQMQLQAADRCRARCRAKSISALCRRQAQQRQAGPRLMSTGSSHSISFGSGARRARPSCEPMMPGTMYTRGASARHCTCVRLPRELHELRVFARRRSTPMSSRACSP